MKVDEKVVKTIAQLAQLELTVESTQESIDSMSDILNLVDQMHQVDTKGIEPMANPLDAVQKLRDDKVTESDQRALFQSIAPSTEDGLYLVPKVIE